MKYRNLPDLFPILRVLVDRPRANVRFLLPGSASPDLLKQSSESLAGRLMYHELKGFSLDGVGVKELDSLWLRGGFPKVGSSWEGFALEEVIHHIGARQERCYFWATHAGAELDLLVIRGRSRRGFEFKRTVAPKLTKSMHAALKDLKLTRLYVMHAGDGCFPLSGKVQAVSLSHLLDSLKPLR